MTGMNADGVPGCNIDLRIWRLDDSGNDPNMGVTIGAGFNEEIFLTTFGLNAATCQQVTMQERLSRGYSPLSEPPSEAVIAALHDRIVAAVRSHLRILAICTAMKKPVAPFPIALFDESVPDLRRAIQAVEQGWTAHRHRVNPVARKRETGR